VVTSTEERLGVDFRRVGFDVDAFVRATPASGMPYAEDAAGRFAAREPTAF
jgi:hypothetical protein